MSITPAQENERMLARILGIDEDRAAVQLAQTVSITAGDGEAESFAEELADQLARTVHVVTGAQMANLEVMIGAPPAGRAPKQLFVAITSDAITVSTQRIDGEAPRDLHGIQRVIGACYTASVVLANLIDGVAPAAPADPFVVSFERLGATRDVLATPITLEEAVLAGAGAVGSGFLRAARHLDIRGGLTVADPKVVGGGNPNRCFYFTEADVGKPKAGQLCANAQPDFPNLKLAPYTGTFADIVKARGKVRRVIVGTDSRPARRSIQQELPLEVLDASTTGVSEVVIHSHRQPTGDACLACIYPHVSDELARERDIATGLGVGLTVVTSGALIDAAVARTIKAKHPSVDEAALIGMAFDSLFKQLCAEQALLSASGEQVFAPFAFVSNLAGALLALELARFESGVRFADGMNYLAASPWAAPHGHLRRRRPRLPGCIFCGNPSARDVLASIWPSMPETRSAVAVSG
jgi:molybdopterin/thiamine biosynthesis adenylyltransferase